MAGALCPERFDSPGRLADRGSGESSTAEGHNGALSGGCWGSRVAQIDFSTHIMYTPIAKRPWHNMSCTMCNQINPPWLPGSPCQAGIPLESSDLRIAAVPSVYPERDGRLPMVRSGFSPRGIARNCRGETPLRKLPSPGEAKCLPALRCQVQSGARQRVSLGKPERARRVKLSEAQGSTIAQAGS